MPQDATGRDVRIDQIGFVGELVKLHAEPLKDLVKARMKRDKLDAVEGDCFTGLLVPSTVTEISPAGLLRLYEKKEITKAQFVACLAVRKDAAAQVLPGKALSRITTTSAGPPALRSSRVQAVADPLADAMARLRVCLDKAA